MSEDDPSLIGDNKHLLWCPFAKTDFPPAPTKGAYEKGYPMGAIVHFTAGRRRALNGSIDSQIESGCTYFLIDKDGIIAQNFPLDRWGYHAGETKDGIPKSYWPGLGDNVSHKIVGIEVQCAGRVKEVAGGKFKPGGFDLLIDPSEVRHIPRDVDEQQEHGYYHKYTDAQEASLKRLILWLHRNNTDVFSLDFVLGHDEVSGPQGIGKWRKNDPGGALSSTMKEFRQTLKSMV